MPFEQNLQHDREGDLSSCGSVSGAGVGFVGGFDGGESFTYLKATKNRKKTITVNTMVRSPCSRRRDATRSTVAGVRTGPQAGDATGARCRTM